MKNITVTIDETTYRRARIAAAERSSSISRLVREYLQSLELTRASESDPASTLFSALDKARNFRAGKRMNREDTHER